MIERALHAKRGTTQVMEFVSEIEATVIKADGTRVPLGVITSPYTGRFANKAWKVAKSWDVRRRLGR